MRTTWRRATRTSLSVTLLALTLLCELTVTTASAIDQFPGLTETATAT
ncbi:MAG: hypothetical protein H7123_04730, partial [Thermoleophilia bacterium]|nr:hypothetical protein [Thermoleophilia bacterium]